MILQPVNADQIKPLQAICNLAYAQSFADHWEQNGLELYLEDQFGTKRLIQDLADPLIAYYLIKYEEKIAGFIKIKLEAALDGFETTKTAELEKFYILQEYKGLGIGKTALRMLMQFLAGLQKMQLFLCVIDTNHTAIAFYQKMGFKFHSKTELDARYFKKELKGMHRMIVNLSPLKIK